MCTINGMTFRAPPAHCPPFYKLVCWLSAMVNSDCSWHLSHFPWSTAFTCMFATSILWCYNFNGMIKWYDISCATLYFTPVPRNISGNHVWVDSRPIVWPEVYCQWQIPMMPSGIKSMTFQVVEQCLNQLLQHVSPGVN
jgi:hypothetical protein